MSLHWLGWLEAFKYLNQCHCPGCLTGGILISQLSSDRTWLTYFYTRTQPFICSLGLRIRPLRWATIGDRERRTCDSYSARETWSTDSESRDITSDYANIPAIARARGRGTYQRPGSIITWVSLILWRAPVSWSRHVTHHKDLYYACPDQTLIEVGIRHPVNAKLYKQLVLFCSAYFYFVSAHITLNYNTNVLLKNGLFITMFCWCLNIAFPLGS